MTWTPSDTWRDSYDAWKLATPPEYEMTGEEEQRLERERAEDRIDELMQMDETPEILAEIAREREYLATEPCPGCDVEWADMLAPGEVCSLCHGKRRVRRMECEPVSEASDIYDDPSPDDDLDWCPF